MNFRELLSKLDSLNEAEADDLAAYQRGKAAQDKLNAIEQVKKMAATPLNQIPRLGDAIDPKTGIIYYGEAGMDSFVGNARKMPYDWMLRGPTTDTGKLTQLLKTAGLEVVPHEEKGLFGNVSKYAKVEPAKLNAVLSGEAAAAPSATTTTPQAAPQQAAAGGEIDELTRKKLEKLKELITLYNQKKAAAAQPPSATTTSVTPQAQPATSALPPAQSAPAPAPASAPASAAPTTVTNPAQASQAAPAPSGPTTVTNPAQASQAAPAPATATDASATAPAPAPAAPPRQAALPATNSATLTRNSVVQRIQKNPDGTYTFTNADGKKINLKEDGTIIKEWMPSISEQLIESFENNIDEGLAGDALKAGGKLLGKTAAKALPGVGVTLSAQDAWERWQKGDRTGAVISALAGVGWLIPGPAGWIIGGGLDAANFGRDMSKPDTPSGQAGDGPTASTTAPATQGTKKDPKIIALQDYLKKKGAKNLDGSPLTVDGIWGKNTAAAMTAMGLNESEKITLLRLQLEAIDSYKEPLDEGKLDIIKGLFRIGKGGSKEAAALAKDIPVGTIVKDAKGSNWKWMGGRWEKETAAGSGKFNMRQGVATPGTGKTAQVADDLAAAYRAEAEAAKKAGTLAQWIKANPVKASAIGITTGLAAGLAGGSIEQRIAQEPATSTSVATTTPSSRRDDDRGSTTQQGTLPDDLAALKKQIDDLIADLQKNPNPKVKEELDKLIALYNGKIEQGALSVSGQSRAAVPIGTTNMSAQRFSDLEDQKLGLVRPGSPVRP